MISEKFLNDELKLSEQNAIRKLFYELYTNPQILKYLASQWKRNSSSLGN